MCRKLCSPPFRLRQPRSTPPSDPTNGLTSPKSTSPLLTTFLLQSNNDPHHLRHTPPSPRLMSTSPSPPWSVGTTQRRAHHAGAARRGGRVCLTAIMPSTAGAVFIFPMGPILRMPSVFSKRIKSSVPGLETTVLFMSGTTTAGRLLSRSIFEFSQDSSQIERQESIPII